MSEVHTGHTEESLAGLPLSNLLTIFRGLLEEAERLDYRYQINWMMRVSDDILRLQDELARKRAIRHGKEVVKEFMRQYIDANGV